MQELALVRKMSSRGRVVSAYYRSGLEDVEELAIVLIV